MEGKARELSEIVKVCKSIFGISDISELQAVLIEATLQNRVDLYHAFVEAVALDAEPIQKIFQYWMADRDIAKQDFTPPSLGCLVARLSGNANTVYDCCAGVGTLTVAAHRVNPAAAFICDERDDIAIPFLLFNLALHNIKAVVRRIDILNGDIFEIYTTEPGEQYARITRL